MPRRGSMFRSITSKMMPRIILLFALLWPVASWAADPTLTSSANGTANTSSVNAAFGFTATAGRLLVLSVGADDYNSGNPSGWTLSTGMEQQAFLGAYIWWKIAAGGETSVTYTIGSATGSAWTVMEFDNVDPTPYDTSNGQFANSNAATYTTPTITPSTGRRLLVAQICGARSPIGTLSDINTWINSFTEAQQSIQTFSATADIISTAWRVVDGDGATGFSTGATYVGSQPDSRTGQIIAFKVAAGGGGPLPHSLTLMGVGQ